jgi:hypothetical protein
MSTKNKTHLVLVIILALCSLVTGFAVWRYEHQQPWQTKTKCSDYGAALYDPATPDSIKSLAQESPGIIVATVLNPKAYRETQKLDGTRPHVRIESVLKGSRVLHIGDELYLCASQSMTNRLNAISGSKSLTVLVFLEGQEKGHAAWVPTQGRIGVIPEDTDSRFQLWVSHGPDTVTVQELKRAIN